MTMRPSDIKLTKKDYVDSAKESKGTSSKKKKPANRTERTRYEFKQLSPRGKDRISL